jgi:hypothetical protein
MKALVLSLRGCHLGYLGCYGNPWVSTPALDSLAATGFIFDQHLADVPDAAVARRTWREGRHLFPGIATEEPPSQFDLLAALRAQGIKTVLLADGSQPLPESWSTGWDETEKLHSGEGFLLEQVLEVSRAVLAQLAEEDNWLLWIDLATLLPPWQVPADFSDPYFHEPTAEEEAEHDKVEHIEDAEHYDQDDDPLTPWPDPPIGFIHTEDDLDFCRLQATYAGAINYLDAGIGVLLEELEQLGLANDCLVLATSDHGQALGEHGICGPHRPWLHDELLHIPLLLRMPNQPEPARISALTQTVDIVPTVLDVFGLPQPAALHGQSLLPLTRKEGASIRSYACCGLQVGNAIEWCLRTSEWSLLVPVVFQPDDPRRKPQLYVKPDDRCEVNDVWQHHLERADYLERILRTYFHAAAQGGPLEVPALREPEGTPSPV